MAVPKCKVSKARRDQRRGSNWKLSAPSYNGRQVLTVEAE